MRSLIKTLQKSLRDAKRNLNFEDLGEMVGHNVLKHKYLTNVSIWLMDTTMLGSKEVFTIQDLASRRILALCYTNHQESGETELMSTFEAALKSDAVGKPMLILHGDNSQTYKSEAFKKMLNYHGVCLSFTAKLKHGNQV